MKKRLLTGLLCIILLLFMAFPALAAESTPNPAKPIEESKHSLSVEFKDGLFSITAKNALLGEVLAKIQANSGMVIEIDESLKSRLVTIDFKNFGQINSLEIIKNAAGLSGYGFTYKLDKSIDKKKQLFIDKVVLLQKGGVEPVSLKSHIPEIITKVDESLILSTIDKFEATEVAVSKTTYNVLRSEMYGAGDIENIEYTVILEEPVDRIVLVKGKPRENAVRALRYHNLVKELKRRLESGELKREGFGQYRVLPKEGPFEAVIKVNADLQIITGYKLYMEKQLLYKADIMPLDSAFSQIAVRIDEAVTNNSIIETYIKNPGDSL